MKIITSVFNHHIMRYLFSGGTAAMVNLGLLYLLTDIMGLYYLLSGILAFSCGVIVSFIMQKSWTFQDRSTEETYKKFVLYVVIAIINLAVNTSLLFLFTDIFNLYYMISQFLASGIVAVWSYFIYRKMFFYGIMVKQTEGTNIQ